MASIRELIDSNNRGELGAMLASRFKGERGRTYPRGDSEFMVGFPSEEETPPVEALKLAIVEFYTGLGYQIEVAEQSPSDMFEAYVFCQGTRKEEGSIYLVISTRYPLVPAEGVLDHLRVTTTVFT